MFIIECGANYSRALLDLELKVYVTDLDDCTCECFEYGEIEDYILSHESEFVNAYVKRTNMLYVIVNQVTKFIRFALMQYECFYTYNEIWLFCSDDEYVYICCDGEVVTVNDNVVSRGGSLGVLHKEFDSIYFNVFVNNSRMSHLEIRPRDVQVKRGIRKQVCRDILLRGY